MSDPAPELRRLAPSIAPALAAMLAALEASGEAALFRPHPFDVDHLAQALCRPESRDLYYVLEQGEAVLAYGLLRGWDEGYVVPSLGIAVSPDQRRRGLGELMMNWLHAAARLRGSERVRLRVHAGNARAIALYRRLDYQFDATPEGEALLTGFKNLSAS